MKLKPDQQAQIEAIAAQGKSLRTVIPGGLLPEAGAKPKGKANKYGAKPTVYNGVRYQSKAEATRAKALDSLKQMGAVRWWTGQVPFRLGVAECKYVVDFLVEDTDGVHAEDVKGRETEMYRRNRKLWMRFGPVPLWVIRNGKVVEIIEPEEGH